MAQITLFHSVMGLRAAEYEIAQSFQSAGHEVIIPDLFEGQTTESIDQGFAIKDRIGWAVIMERAQKAMAKVAENAAMVGVSMGAGVISDLLPLHPKTSGVLLLHALTGIPAELPQKMRIQAHIASADQFLSAADVSAWEKGIIAAGASPEVFLYPGARHFYTDRTSSEYDQASAELTLQRSANFLSSL